LTKADPGKSGTLSWRIYYNTSWILYSLKKSTHVDHFFDSTGGFRLALSELISAAATITCAVMIYG